MEDCNLALSGDTKRIAHRVLNKISDGNAKILAVQTTSLAGVEAYAISYELDPPLKLILTAKKAAGLLVVPQPQHGETARCFHLFVPQTEWENYKLTFLAIVNSVRIQTIEPEQKAATVKAGTEEPIVQRILERLKQGRITIPSASISVDTSPGGASSVNGFARRNVNQIVLTLGAIRKLPEDELAFLIAHEMGHLMDMSDACENSESHEQHQCEDTADFTAEQILLGRGHSGYAGAGLMGGFMMMGDRASFTNQLFVTLFR